MRTIDITQKQCPICGAKTEIEAEYCKICGWFFPALSNIEGIGVEADKSAIILARSRWESKSSFDGKNGHSLKLENVNKIFNCLKKYKKRYWLHIISGDKHPTLKPNYTKYILGALVVALGVIVGIWLGNRETTPHEPTAEEVVVDTTTVKPVTIDSAVISQQAVAEYKKQEEQRLKEETERKQREEQARLTEEKRKQEEADRKAREEQARLAEQKRKQEETTKRSGTIAGHDYVDLGLSVKWATCNVGASQPHRYGYYYAWGETSTKNSYENDNSRTYGERMSDISGNASYDAARANWGSTWRLPTKREMQELVDKCTWQWTTQSGVEGYKVTGPNGNSIFLPAAGYYYGSSYDGVGKLGYYWSSAPYESNDYCAYSLGFSSGLDVLWNYRYRGRTVRPVSE